MKRKGMLIALLSMSVLLSACGGNDDSAVQEELESLRAENESLKTETEAAVQPQTEGTTETSAAESVETTASEAVPASDGWASYDGCSIKINDAYLVKDYNDEDAVVLEMQFKNDSDDKASCGFTFNVDVFQDGIECDMAILWKSDYDTGTFTTDIKPGAELTVYKAFKLNNTSSDVEVEVSGLFDFNSEILLEHTFTM